MSQIIAVDRDGRRWELLSVEGVLRARLVSGQCMPNDMDLDDLVDAHGPLVLPPARPADEAFIDTVDLVATDPETASIQHIEVVAGFARSVIAGPCGRTHSAMYVASRAGHTRASQIGQAGRGEMWGAGVDSERGGTRVTE
ncbi:hypothetical protein [Prescottella subtropica]|uniref:hypothetical protein n=1 Tax=Prescottella subtropica TaxID=2545757 RepID=UPI001883F11B|nr:hypothetical protein [Prescottella subtropica]